MATTKLMTAEDLEELPSDAYRYDMIWGELRRREPGSYQRGVVVARIAAAIGFYARTHGLGEVVISVGFILERDPDTVLAPGVAFVRKDRVPPEGEQDHFAALPPDLAVETVSPGDRAGDSAEKVAIYQAAGVRLLWVLYPTRHAVRVHRPGRALVELGEDDVLDGEDVLPGSRLPIRDILR